MASKHFRKEMFEVILMEAGPAVNPSVVSAGILLYSFGNCGGIGHSLTDFLGNAL